MKPVPKRPGVPVIRPSQAKTVIGEVMVGHRPQI